ncbi:DUF4139 domain-containing protein [Sulfitobacter guttiformis]|uniref:Uncharacterized protein (TIGR02231 family) n=1 Tax=Sulfitobacter guttiformis TaxID=74349 RepID=A0A420DSM5_9RHOB|nr:DUF4139 domain-containing protein [Sulfitobacter guttiformis]KIN74680.1 DUF4139 multi-domain protein [Sulfitobacter guttiformis KCTC 32187]RKE97255.1 uncharacterized protein (TIGR02231 family) [Sulfitobacter guttiformis]
MRLLTLALAALPLPVLAETFTVSSAPTAVTVYGGFALVTRDVTVEVGVGAHELILPDLPQWVNAGSLRVSLEGAILSGTRLRNDALPPQKDKDSAEVTAAKDRIETAERALTYLDDRAQDAGLAVQAAQARLTFLQGLSSSGTLPSTPEELAGLGEMIEGQTLEATAAQISALRRVRDITDARPDLESALEDARTALVALTPPEEPKTLLALSIAADQAGPVIASISYPAQASWQPTYDILLTRGNDAHMTLRRAALIYQSTGENWQDVILTLSTLAPSGQVMPSEIYPPLLQYGDPQESAKLQRNQSGLTADALAAPVMINETMRPQPNFDGPGVTYTLPNTISVARDAEGARVELDALDFDARVFARAVPSRDTTAFLMAEATNTTREPLLAADSAQVFVDGALVGQSNFAPVPAGGTFAQAFGPIEDLRLTRAVLEKSEGDRGFINRNNAQVQDVRLSVENLGSESWNVELLEGVPYSEQDDLQIEWNAEPRASETDVEDRRGLTQWNFTLPANATQEVTITQTVRWPEGMVLR